MKTWLLYSIVGASALSVGAGAGIIYKRVISEPTENIVGFNPELCKPDAAQLFEAVEKAGSPEKATQELEPFEIVNYSFEKYKQTEYSVSFCSGLADTAVKQYIRSVQIKQQNTYFEEQISKSSMVGVAKRMLQEGVEADTKVFHETGSGDVVVDGDNAYATFKSEPEVLSYENYKEAWGRNLPDMAIYLIAESTVNNQELVKEGNGYKVTLNLNPVKGGYNYRYQMKTISDLAEFPSFSLLDLTYWLDKDLNIIKMNEHSKFTAKMVGISAGVENDIMYHYFPGKNMKIPSLTEKVDYKSLSEEAAK